MLGFIGGTGPEGRGLALRLALADERVLIGSRDAGRAATAAEEISAMVPGGSVGGGLNLDVAKRAQIVFLSMPYAGLKDTVASLGEELTGKIVVDVVSPLVFKKGRAEAIRVEEGSTALQAQALLPQSKVVAGFQTISAEDLVIPDKPIDSDVVICSDDADAKETVMGLAEKIQGVRAVDGGGLANARYVEDFTALLLNINRIYKSHSSLRIVGI